MNDLQLLRIYEPVVKYTEGELFFPMAIEPYIAASSLWQMDPNKQRRELVPAGELTAERLAMQPEPPAGHTLYLRFQKEPLGAREYQHWRSRSDRPILHAAGRLTASESYRAYSARCLTFRCWCVAPSQAELRPPPTLPCARYVPVTHAMSTMAVCCARVATSSCTMSFSLP